MKHMGLFAGAVIVAFVLTVSYTDNSVFANSCCGIEQGDKDGEEGCVMEVASGEKTGNNCPVCGADSGSKGSQVDAEHDGETVHLCCEGCATAYNENPDKYSEEEKKPVQRKRATIPTRKQPGQGYR